MARRNLSLLLFALAFTLLCWSRAEKNPYARYLSESFTAIDDGALERVPGEELFDTAVTSMVATLHKRGDENSQFIPAELAEPFLSEMRQEFGGIGVRIAWQGDPPQLTVMGLPEPGSPAFDAKIQPGDRIVAIDDTPMSDIVAEGMEKPLLRLRGAPGSTVRLTIERDGIGQPLNISLVREIIVVHSVIGDRRRADGSWDFFLPDAPGIAYVRITSFGDKTVGELTAVLARLSHEGMQSLVLDLRDNAGGVLDAAVGVCDLFLKEDAPIVEIRGRERKLQERFTSSGKGKYTQLPIAVLVNGDSASASEIVAACLQDNQRAVVVGERSFGKGTVQHAILIEPGRTRKSWLKLTSASYWRPSGANIHRTSDAPANGAWGVSPNDGFEIELDADAQAALRKSRFKRDVDVSKDAKPIDDPALTRAVEFLQSK
ncbi:MAG: S41 family peptidase [Pirellulales bacterium]